MPASTVTPDPLIVSRSDAGVILQLSARQIDKLIEKGQLDSVSIGRRRLVKMDSIRQLAENGTPVRRNSAENTVSVGESS